MRFMETSLFIWESFSNLVTVVYACQPRVCLTHTELFLVSNLVRFLVMLVFKSHEVSKSCTGLFAPCLWKNSLLSSCCRYMNFINEFVSCPKTCFSQHTRAAGHPAFDFNNWWSYFTWNPQLDNAFYLIIYCLLVTVSSSFYFS